jgi:hypothetical protein
MADDPEQQGLEDIPRRRALDAERDMAGLLARQPGRVPAGDLEGDLGSGVAGSDHEDAALLELGRVVVAGRMELDDVRPEVGGEGGTRGTWKLDMATTAWSASQLRSPATTTNLPSALESRSTRTPVRTGSWNRAA